MRATLGDGIARFPPDSPEYQLLMEGDAVFDGRGDVQMRERMAAEEFEHASAFLEIVDDRGGRGHQHRQVCVGVLHEVAEQHEALSTQGEQAFGADLRVMDFVDRELAHVRVVANQLDEAGLYARLLQRFVIQNEVAVRDPRRPAWGEGFRGDGGAGKGALNSGHPGVDRAVRARDNGQ